MYIHWYLVKHRTFQFFTIDHILLGTVHHRTVHLRILNRGEGAQKWTADGIEQQIYEGKDIFLIFFFQKLCSWIAKFTVTTNQKEDVLGLQSSKSYSKVTSSLVHVTMEPQLASCTLALKSYRAIEPWGLVIFLTWVPLALKILSSYFHQVNHNMKVSNAARHNGCQSLSQQRQVGL